MEGARGLGAGQSLERSDGWGQGKSQLGCMEEAAPASLKDKQKSAFWKDEESVVSGRDSLSQGLAFAALATVPLGVRQ